MVSVLTRLKKYFFLSTAACFVFICAASGRAYSGDVLSDDNSAKWAQFLTTTCSAPVVKDAANARSIVKSGNASDVLPGKYVDEMTETLASQNSAQLIQQFFRQDSIAGQPTLSADNQRQATKVGYGVAFGDPVCTTTGGGSGGLFGGAASSQKKCDYYAYSHRQLTMVPREGSTLEDVVNKYTTHVRSPRSKKYEWSYFEHNEKTGAVSTKSSWSDQRDPGQMELDKTYWITKCVKPGSVTVCDSFRYKLIKLDDKTYALVTVANSPKDSGTCKPKGSDVEPGFTRRYVLAGYSSITLIKDTGENFMIADVGSGHSTDETIIQNLSTPDKQAMVKDMHHYDYEALSSRLSLRPNHLSQYLGGAGAAGSAASKNSSSAGVK